MAKYKRQKVKHYHRSFYSREMRVKRGIGIVVLVAAVLAAAWFAAPHVLDWATHTSYTVVKDRDLEAESASRAEAAASSAAASSAAASQAASELEPEEEKPLDGKAVTGGSWAELDVTTLTDEAAIRAAGAEGDSVGGVLETAILGLPAGIGEPYFDSVESEIAHLAFSIPAVKGIEFGSGFGFADQKGSEANDAFRMQGERIVTATNHNAGLNGGISNGMPVVFRTAVKPTPSIYKTQDTVDYIAKKDAELSIQGRHDPCIVPRAAIVQTCAAALAVGDLLTAKYGMAWMEDPTGYRKEVL